MYTGMPEVVAAFESRVNKLHTTHSWNFLGLETSKSSSKSSSGRSSSLWRKAKYGADVIIGHIDSGAAMLLSVSVCLCHSLTLSLCVYFCLVGIFLHAPIC
jgi:hypothetical protein